VKFRAAVVVMALAIAAAPLLLDACLLSCHAAQAAAAGTPSCHHSSGRGARVHAAPMACSHDYGDRSGVIDAREPSSRAPRDTSPPAAVAVDGLVKVPSSISPPSRLIPFHADLQRSRASFDPPLRI
jgi:hypothetical protein